MRIPIWPGVRLSVWERQNPDAVKVTLARSTPYEPVRRVLSMRGWMLLWVRYDWKDHSRPEEQAPAKSVIVQELTRELHRRITHLETLRAASDDVVSNEQWLMVVGEVQGLRGSLGIALGGTVRGGIADELAQHHYQEWVLERASRWNRCRCELCTAAVDGASR